MNESSVEIQNKHYLIYYKGASDNYGGHSVIYFVLAPDPAQAIIRFLLVHYPELVVEDDGSILVNGARYPHPLAFVEVWFKTYGEWQIREFPEWTLLQSAAEVFCGESSDGPAEIVGLCRKLLTVQFPRSRARAFVWYLRQGTLVTFYRGRRNGRMEVLQRCLWNWDGRTETMEEWKGDYSTLMADLNIDIIRY